MSMPVAVVMPVRNGAAYVAEAIDSILAQTVPPAEVVVVDDGSDDATPRILAGFGDRIRTIRQATAGQFVAMNRAIAATSAPVLGFLDADDLFVPRSLEVRLARLTAGDAPEAVYGRIEQFVSPELAPEEVARLRYDTGHVQGELFQAMLIRRVAFERVGPLDVGPTTSANIDWVSRARAAGLVSVRIDDLVARRRLHLTNIGRTAAEQKRQDLLEIVRRHRQRVQRIEGSPG